MEHRLNNEKTSDQALQPVFMGWGEHQTLTEVAELITTQVQVFLKLDRIVVYQFDREYNGQVIAETCDESRLPSLKGLHFPATDIPPQARQRLFTARQRVIIDVDSKRKILVSQKESATGHSLTPEDIRYAPVDPCHLQYLLGLGVLSSITFSIVHQGQLWGLLVGHHSDPRQFSEAEIQTVQLWVDQLSVALAQHLLRQQVKQHQQQADVIDRLNLLLAQEELSPDCWQKVLQLMMQHLDADGCRLYVLPGSLGEQGFVHTCGVQPAVALESDEIWNRYYQALEHTHDSSITAALEPVAGRPPILVSTSRRWDGHADGQFLTQLLQPADISAVLVVPIHWQYEMMGYLSFFRLTHDTEITWAGQHNDDVRNDLPRASFAAWREQQRQVRGWQSADLEMANLASRYLYMGVMQHWLRRQANQKAAHDAMTDLPNWLLFNKQLQLSLLQCLRQGKGLAVGILNLEQFKRINTTYGHTVGNYLLKSVAHRLKECLDQHLQWETAAEVCPTLARWHGDRFALLLPATVGKEAVRFYAEALLGCLQRPFWIQGEDVYLTANMGIALAPYDGDTAEALIQHAEAALYETKHQGHSRYLIYASMAGIEDSLSQQRLANDLYRALTQQELLLHYQPQVDLATGNIIGLEALVRWQHPQLGLVPPDKFIAIAEEVGLIGQLDTWVLRRACLQYQQWRQAGLPALRLAVNVSANQFSSAQVVGLVQEVLQDTAIAPGELELEITEETVTRNLQQATGILGQLKEMGIKIALDDFGVGYSSLNVLKHFPVDTLKIDKSFLQNCPENAQDAAIVETVITLGHNLNLVVLAEGVETQEQVIWLQKLHCDLLQGYYFSRPQPPEALLPWLEGQMGRGTSLKPGRQSRGLAFGVVGSGAGEAPGRHPLPSLLKRTDLWCKPEQVLQTVGSGLKPYFSKLPRLGSSQPSGNPLPTAAPLPEAEPVSITSLTAALQPNPQRQHLQREQLIRSVTEKIRQSLHLDDILTTIVEEVRRLIDTDRVILYKFSERWDGRVVQESVSPDFPAILGQYIEDHCFSSEYVKYYRQGRVRAIEDVTTAGIADCHRDMLLGFGVRANLVLPVAFQDQLWGLLIAHHCHGTRVWRQDEVELLGQLAVQSAIAIHQGELYQQLELSNRALQKLSSQDRLTQLANRGRFDQKLQEEWQRLARTEAPLALVFYDIDHFKSYNDTYGHPAGDRCLRQVAAVLQNAVQRPGDLVARYGGEEFVLLLPETNQDGACQVAARIQQALDELAIPHGGSPLQRVTLSCGIACRVPQPKESSSSLLQQADDALYRAKAAGRNQTALAESWT